MEYKHFEKLMTSILDLHKQQREIGKVLENICSSSWCIVTIGDNLVTTMIDFLTEHFNCGDEYGGLINWWLYDDVERRSL